MGIFGRLFGSQKELKKGGVTSEAGKVGYEVELKKHFGLTRRGDGWSYEGHINDQFASQLGDPEVCLLVLQKLRDSLKFDQICIVTGRPIVIVANVEKPFCMMTNLSAPAVADVVSSILRAGGTLREYQGLFWMKLPPTLHASPTVPMPSSSPSAKSADAKDKPSASADHLPESQGNASVDRSWLNLQVQAGIRQRAQSSLDGEDEQTTVKLAALYKAYDRVCNYRNGEDKAACERIGAEAAEIGKTLCERGGAKRMLLVAFRAERHGARVRTIELWWDGICGWMW